MKDIPKHYIPVERISIEPKDSSVGEIGILMNMYTSDGRYASGFTIQDALYLLKNIPKLFQINRSRGLKLEDHVRYLGTNPKQFLDLVTVYRDESGITGLSYDKSSICFTYSRFHNNHGEISFDPCFADIVEYPTANLEGNLDKPIEIINSLYPIKKKDILFREGFVFDQ